MPALSESLPEGPGFVFRGVVSRAGATMPEVPMTAGTVVVEVAEVLQAPADLKDLAGAEITVQLRQPGSPGIGEQAVFSTEGWLYGSSIAVRELAHQDARTAVAMREELSQAAHDREDGLLRERIAQATLVLSGRVVGLKEARRVLDTRVSEHDAQWWEATIAVQTVEKGEYEGDMVKVLFPASDDVMWYAVPKLRAREEGLWFLRPGGVTEVDPEAFAILSPLDMQRKDELQRVRALIREGE
jgi:hypothetical protein